ncbi:hemerythrin domain-containing protein, partial [Rhodocyclaceae bacterium SMB388]
LAKRLRSAPSTDAAVADAAAEVRTLRGELERHFDEEEATLLPILRICDPESATQLMREHGELRTLLTQTENAAALTRLGTLLEAHVRFEERRMFPSIEAWWAASETPHMEGRPSGKARTKTGPGQPRKADNSKETHHDDRYQHLAPGSHELLEAARHARSGGPVVQ